MSLLKKILAVLFATGVLLLSVELGLRAIGFAYDPYDLMRPTFVVDHGIATTDRFYTDHPLLVIPGTLDGVGPGRIPFVPPQRFPLAKPAGTLRLALLGGSTVHLMGDAAALRDRVQQATGRPVQIINFGFMGCGSERELASAHEAIALGADVVVLYTGHNEFESFSNRALSPHRTGGRWLRPLMSLRFVQLAVRAALEWRNPDQLVWMEHPATFTPAAKERIYAAFERNVRGIAEACAAGGVPLVIGTAAYNLELPPHEWPEALDRWNGEADKSLLAAATDWPQALAPWSSKTDEQLVAATTANPPDAVAAYVLGLRQAKGLHWPGAKDWFELSLELTVHPSRANRRINTILRSTAAEKGAALAPVQETIEAASPNGMPGFDFFLDDCHLTPGAKDIALTTLGEAVVRSLALHQARQAVKE